MDQRDLMVACISTGLGIAMIYGILANPDWLFRLRTPRTLERNLGRRRAKLVLGAVSAGLILVGAHLATGPWLPSVSMESYPDPATEKQADILSD